MLKQLQSRLRPIRRRQRLDRALRWGTVGLMLGAIWGSIWLLAAWLGAALNSELAWTILPASVFLCMVAGLLWPAGWRSSARLVDSVYGLKDRTLTALEFASRHDDRHALRALQIDDALHHLADVEARRVVPWRSPRFSLMAIAAIAIMLGLGFLPIPQSASIADVPRGPLPVVLEQSELLEQTMMKDLEELADEVDDPEVKELREQMQRALEELKGPEVDQREALAQLSQMQATLAAAMKQLNIQQLDAQLEELANALQVADASQAASQALRESKYEQAAEQLERIEVSSMDRKQRDALRSNLAKLSKKLGQGKKGQLSDAVQDIVDGLDSENDSKCKSGFCKAAGICRKQGLKKKISDCLACQLNRLSACKGACQGVGHKPSSSVAKSDSPSNSAGTGASNQPTGGEKTELDSDRRDEDLTGIAGEGPSERETVSVAEARQNAARTYRQRYDEYRKQMEEVLDSEPLPLGHRETVRKYFESIRPTNEQSELVGQD